MEPDGSSPRLRPSSRSPSPPPRSPSLVARPSSTQGTSQDELRRVRYVLKDSLTKDGHDAAIYSSFASSAQTSLIEARTTQNLLNQEGLSAKTVKRIHSLLLVYSAGFYELVVDIQKAAGPLAGAVVANLTKMLVYLLQQMQPENCEYELKLAALEKKAWKGYGKIVKQREQDLRGLMDQQTALGHQAEGMQRQIEKLQLLRQQQQARMLTVQREALQEGRLVDETHTEIDQMENTKHLWRQRAQTHMERALMREEDERGSRMLVERLRFKLSTLHDEAQVLKATKLSSKMASVRALNRLMAARQDKAQLEMAHTQTKITLEVEVGKRGEWRDRIPGLLEQTAELTPVALQRIKEREDVQAKIKVYEDELERTRLLQRVAEQELQATRTAQQGLFGQHKQVVQAETKERELAEEEAAQLESMVAATEACAEEEEQAKRRMMQLKAENAGLTTESVALQMLMKGRDAAFAIQAQRKREKEAELARMRARQEEVRAFLTSTDNEVAIKKDLLADELKIRKSLTVELTRARRAAEGGGGKIREQTEEKQLELDRIKAEITTHVDLLATQADATSKTQKLIDQKVESVRRLDDKEGDRDHERNKTGRNLAQLRSGNEMKKVEIARLEAVQAKCEVEGTNAVKLKAGVAARIKEAEADTVVKEQELAAVELRCEEAAKQHKQQHAEVVAAVMAINALARGRLEKWQGKVERSRKTLEEVQRKAQERSKKASFDFKAKQLRAEAIALESYELEQSNESMTELLVTWAQERIKIREEATLRVAELRRWETRAADLQSRMELQTVAHHRASNKHFGSLRYLEDLKQQVVQLQTEIVEMQDMAQDYARARGEGAKKFSRSTGTSAPRMVAQQMQTQLQFSCITQLQFAITDEPDPASGSDPNLEPDADADADPETRTASASLKVST